MTTGSHSHGARGPRGDASLGSSGAAQPSAETPLPELSQLLTQGHEVFDQLLASPHASPPPPAAFLDDFNDLWRNLSNNWHDQLSNIKPS